MPRGGSTAASPVSFSLSRLFLLVCHLVSPQAWPLHFAGGALLNSILPTCRCHLPACHLTTSSCVLPTSCPPHLYLLCILNHVATRMAACAAWCCRHGGGIFMSRAAGLGGMGDARTAPEHASTCCRACCGGRRGGWQQPAWPPPRCSSANSSFSGASSVPAAIIY